MGFARRTLRFGSGLILGAAVGTAVSVLFAPQNGDELKAELQDRAEEAKRAGEEAELLETERLQRLFRVAVKDPTALTGKFDDRKREKTPAEEAAEKLKKERDEAAKASREAAKAEAAVRKAQEDAEKARAQIAKAEEAAQKARDKRSKEEADVAKAYETAVEKSQDQTRA
jgi:colicin import membrane protein